VILGLGFDTALPLVSRGHCKPWQTPIEKINFEEKNTLKSKMGSLLIILANMHRKQDLAQAQKISSSKKNTL
jgi:hypothetical protein